MGRRTLFPTLIDLRIRYTIRNGATPSRRTSGRMERILSWNSRVKSNPPRQYSAYGPKESSTRGQLIDDMFTDETAKATVYQCKSGTLQTRLKQQQQTFQRRLFLQSSVREKSSMQRICWSNEGSLESGQARSISGGKEGATESSRPLGKLIWQHSVSR